MQSFKNLLIGIFGSRKVQMTIAGLIVSYLAKKGFNVSDEVVVAILGAFAAYVLSQGIADSGKEAAKIKAVSDSANPPVPGADEAVSKMADDVKQGPR